MTEDEAIQLARSIAEQEGWPWRGTVTASRSRRGLVGRPEWLITSNAQARGLNVRVRIDDHTGQILSREFAPR